MNLTSTFVVIVGRSGRGAPIFGRRMPNNRLFDEVLNAVSMDDALSALGLEHPRGRALRCPFPDNHTHGDRSRSAQVTRRDDGIERFNCFGCHAWGDVVDLTMAVLNLDTMGAVQWLASRFNILVPADAPSIPDPKPSQRAALKALGVELTLPTCPPGLDGMYAYIEDERSTMQHKWRMENTPYADRMADLRGWYSWALRLIQARVSNRPARSRRRRRRLKVS